ncbi:penicillin-binding protein, 1A family [Candidatus Magnetomorum sp. HK-1]|nr:penicillin-binding protein, 1A family [Candidatus Magnetomorum sp. HK-1]
MYGEDSVYSSGMKVYTSLQYNFQEIAEKVVKTTLEQGTEPFYYKKQKISSRNFKEAALFSINPRNGHVLAMVGGSDFKKNEFNKIILAKRQPGSAFKPFTYLAALEKGLSPGTIIEDSPVTYNTLEGPYSPQNYSKRFRGALPLRRGLELSINVIAIKIINLIKPTKVIEIAKKLGITTQLKNILSLTLGACEVKMIDMTYAYGVLANSGLKAKPIFILSIEDRNGVEIYRNKSNVKKVFESNLIHTLVDMMKGIVLYGTGRGAALPRPMAGKTGTTSDHRDAWFIGFVPQMVTLTWVGNDDNSPMHYVTGGSFPARMWKKYMKDALKDVPVIDFPKPRGLIPMKVCWESGLKAVEHCPKGKVSFEKYWKQDMPNNYCDLHSSYIKRRRQNKINWLSEFFDNIHVYNKN